LSDSPQYKFSIEEKRFPLISEESINFIRNPILAPQNPKRKCFIGYWYCFNCHLYMQHILYITKQTTEFRKIWIATLTDGFCICISPFIVTTNFDVSPPEKDRNS